MRPPVRRRHYLDHVRIGQLGRAVERLAQRGHLDRRVVEQRHEAIEALRREQRLVALDVEHHAAVLAHALDDLGDAVGARGVRGRGHQRLGAEAACGFEDAPVVGGHDHAIET